MNDMRSLQLWDGRDERARLKLKTKLRGLALLHPCFRVDSEKCKNSHFESGLQGYYRTRKIELGII